MYSNFYFIEEVQSAAYDLAVNMEQNIIDGKQISALSLGQFLEIIVNDMLKRRLNYTPPKTMDFSKKLNKLLNTKGIIKHDFKKDLQDTYNKRSDGAHIDPITNKPTEHSRMFYSHLIKKLHYLAYRYYQVVKDETFEKKEFIEPIYLDRDSGNSSQDEKSSNFLINKRNQGDIPKETIDCIFTNQSEGDLAKGSRTLGDFTLTPVNSSGKNHSDKSGEDKSIQTSLKSSKKDEDSPETNFNKFLESLLVNNNVEYAKGNYEISDIQIIKWYKKNLNKFIQSRKDADFKHEFILITEYFMNKWLDIRSQNFSRKEIINKLGLNNEIITFWFKKSVKNNLDEEFPIFNQFFLQNDYIDMYLILNSISDDKTREEIAETANVNVSDLNKYYILGIEGNDIYIPFYKDFKNQYVYKRMGAYLDNLRTMKSSEAQLKTKITDEELFGWYDQGKIDFISGNLRTEKFQDFFLLRFIFLSNKWLELLKNSYSIKKAANEVEITLDEIQEWVNYGIKPQYKNLKGFKNFEAFVNDTVEIIINSMINLLDSGKSIKEASNELDISLEHLDKFYDFGISKRVPYINYYNYLINNYFPLRKEKFLKYLLDGKAKNNAAKLSQLSVEEIDEWYALGKQGFKQHVAFYNIYLKIKIDTYKEYLIKGKSKKDALRLSDLEEEEILSFQDNIEIDILKKRMDLVIKEVLNGKSSSKIAKKLKIKQTLIFDWFEKGLNGESDYINFYKAYYENYVSIGCEIVSSYFEEGLNKKQVVKRMKKEDQDLDIADIEHWISLGLLEDENIHKSKKDNEETINRSEEGILVDDIEDIKELKVDILSKCIGLFDDNLRLVKNNEDCNEFKSKLNYLSFENKIRIPLNIIKVIAENYEEIEYSKRLQLSYLNILHHKNFNDYENIWYWVLKKADDPSFDIDSISKEKIEIPSKEKDFVYLEDIEPEDDSLVITSKDLEIIKEDIFIDESIDDTYYESDIIDYLDDYWEEDLEDDEEKEKEYKIVSKFIEELGRENEMFEGFIDDESNEILEIGTIESKEEIESNEPIESTPLEKEPITETTHYSTILNQKLKSHFEDKIINKELSKSIKEEYNLPNYVIEFLINKFSDNGVDYESIIKVLRYSFTPISRPESFDVVDKISVSLFYKENKYIAKFNNLGIKLEIDSSYPYQYEKLLHGNVWAYVKLKNKENLSIDNLELIESPYFSIDEITDYRKEFTKEEWIDILISSCGINPTTISYETKLLLLMRLIPFVEKNFYSCDLSSKESLKDIFYRNINFNNSQINETLYGLFYNQQKHKKGAISYFDSIYINQFTKITDINRKDKLISFMSKADKTNKDSYNDASLILSDNLNEYVVDFIKSGNRSNKLVNSILCDKEFLDNIHCIIPSLENEEYNELEKIQDVYSNDYGFNDIVLSEYFNKLRDLDCTDLYGKYIRLGEGSNIRDFNAIKLMSSGLIKLLYPDNVYVKEDIQEIIEICLKSRKYIKRMLNQDIELSYIDLESSEEIYI